MELEKLTKKHHRILFFDLLKIISVLLVVLTHFHNFFGLFNLELDVPQMIFTYFNYDMFPDGYFFDIPVYPRSFAMIGVLILIFVSGAVIEYNYAGIKTISQYLSFEFKRFMRLYPAYWVSLGVGILLYPQFWDISAFDFMTQLTGIMIFTKSTSTDFVFYNGTVINPMGWFIPTIFMLYLLFPFLSKFVRQYHGKAILLFLIVGLGSRYLFSIYPFLPGLTPYRTFPLCNIFEFCLGIYIVQQNLYPHNEKNYPTIGKISDFMFYVFIFHVVTGGNLLVTFTLSFFMMYLDKLIQNNAVIFFKTQKKVIAVAAIVIIIVSCLWIFLVQPPLVKNDYYDKLNLTAQSERELLIRINDNQTTIGQKDFLLTDFFHRLTELSYAGRRYQKYLEKDSVEYSKIDANWVKYRSVLRKYWTSLNNVSTINENNITGPF